MHPDEARKLVLAYAFQNRINTESLRKMIGAPSRQSVHAWLNGTEPRGPSVWVRMAKALNLIENTSPMIPKLARELALLVLTDDEPEAKKLAAEIIREMSKNYDNESSGTIDGS